jgi:hypothetical protein
MVRSRYVPIPHAFLHTLTPTRKEKVTQLNTSKMIAQYSNATPSPTGLTVTISALGYIKNVLRVNSSKRVNEKDKGTMVALLVF